MALMYLLKAGAARVNQKISLSGNALDGIDTATVEVRMRKRSQYR